MEDADDRAEGAGPATAAVFDGAAGAPAVRGMAAHSAQGAGAISDVDGQGFAGEPVGGLSDGAGGAG